MEIHYETVIDSTFLDFCLHRRNKQVHVRNWDDLGVVFVNWRFLNTAGLNIHRMYNFVPSELQEMSMYGGNFVYWIYFYNSHYLQQSAESLSH